MAAVCVMQQQILLSILFHISCNHLGHGPQLKALHVLPLDSGSLELTHLLSTAG